MKAHEFQIENLVKIIENDRRMFENKKNHEKHEIHVHEIHVDFIKIQVSNVDFRLLSGGDSRDFSICVGGYASRRGFQKTKTPSRSRYLTDLHVVANFPNLLKFKKI